jgi:hypothetical protein
MSLHIVAIDRPQAPGFQMPDRFRHDVTYFMTPSGEDGAPALAKGEYWIDAASARRWLDDGVIRLVSPLDSTKAAEAEITEEQEAWLEWLVANGIQHIRMEAS